MNKGTTYTDWQTLPGRLQDLKQQFNQVLEIQNELRLPKWLIPCPPADQLDIAKIPNGYIEWAHDECRRVLTSTHLVIANTMYDRLEKCPKDFKEMAEKYYEYCHQGFYHLRILDRMLTYRRLRKPYVELPGYVDELLLCSCKGGLKEYLCKPVAERIFRLQKQIEEGKDPHIDEMLPLLKDQTGTEVLKGRLSQSYHWLIDGIRPNNLPTLDEQCFAIVLGLMMRTQASFEVVKGDMLKMLQLDRIRLPDVVVESFTSVPPAEEINLGDECLICMFSIGEQGPVKTTCGHVFCADCLQTWCKDHTSCPLCRSTIIGVAQRLPERLRPFYHQIGVLLECVTILDVEIDKYLLGGFNEAGKLGLEEMLKHMRTLASNIKAANQKFVEKEKAMRPFKTKVKYAIAREALRAINAIPETWLEAIVGLLARNLPGA